MSTDLEVIILDQMETITALQSKADHAIASGAQDLYYAGVYDRIFDAWEAFALAELGTARPSPVDLAGRPELAALWEAVR